jgi:hypothetical protein
MTTRQREIICIVGSVVLCLTLVWLNVRGTFEAEKSGVAIVRPYVYGLRCYGWPLKVVSFEAFHWPVNPQINTLDIVKAYYIPIKIDNGSEWLKRDTAVIQYKNAGLDLLICGFLLVMFVGVIQWITKMNVYKNTNRRQIVDENIVRTPPATPQSVASPDPVRQTEERKNAENEKPPTASDRTNRQ